MVYESRSLHSSLPAFNLVLTIPICLMICFKYWFCICLTDAVSYRHANFMTGFMCLVRLILHCLIDAVWSSINVNRSGLLCLVLACRVPNEGSD